VELSNDLIRTRGNKFKLIQHHYHYNMRIYNFTNRVIPIWNSLSNYVVSVETITPNNFKTASISFGQIKRYTVRLQSRSLWHREPCYIL